LEGDRDFDGTLEFIRWRFGRHCGGLIRWTISQAFDGRRLGEEEGNNVRLMEQMMVLL